MKNFTDWTRLAADASDELRSLVSELDQAISEKQPDVPLLERGA